MRISERLADLKAAQEKGTYTCCPRCGQDTMKPDLYTNALSRIADIMVCDTCGVDEAKLAFMNVKSTLYSWAAFQPNRIPADFKDRPGEDVWKEISVSYPSILFRLFERALNGEPQEEIRLDAFESVPGLTQIWTQPFYLKFQVADGMLVLRFKKHESGDNEITADLVK